MLEQAIVQAVMVVYTGQVAQAFSLPLLKLKVTYKLIKKNKN